MQSFGSCSTLILYTFQDVDCSNVTLQSPAIKDSDGTDDNSTVALNVNFKPVQYGTKNLTKIMPADVRSSYWRTFFQRNSICFADPLSKRPDVCGSGINFRGGAENNLLSGNRAIVQVLRRKQTFKYIKLSKKHIFIEIIGPALCCNL